MLGTGWQAGVALAAGRIPSASGRSGLLSAEAIAALAAEVAQLLAFCRQAAG